MPSRFLGQPVAVQRRGIEEAHAMRQGVLDGGHRLRFRDLAVQPGAEPDPRHPQASFAAGRGRLLLPCAGMTAAVYTVDRAPRWDEFFGR